MKTWRPWLVAATLGAVLAACTDPITAPSGAMRADGLNAVISDPVPSGTQTCPNTGTDGWTKIDANSGSASGAWGSLSYPQGTTMTVNVNAGYVLEVCIKSGSEVGTVIYTVTGPEVNGQITIAQNISHSGWRVTTEPPTVELQDLSVSKGASATYDRTYAWTLTKTVDGVELVTFNGEPGQVFPDVDWEVIADKTETVGNYAIWGQIGITNPNPVAVNVSVADVLYDGLVALGTAVAVDCDAVTMGNQSTGTVPADGSLTCNYTAAPANMDADLNRATVTVTGYTPPPGPVIGTIEGGIATAAISWVENVIGDDEVTLADGRFSFSELISADRTENFPETFACPVDPALYTNGVYTNTVTNTATLDGPNTDLDDDAAVTVNCTAWQGETATGEGYAWSLTNRAPATWFMYTPFGSADLIAGQHYDAGDITMARNGTTSITITLHAGFRFADASNNVKINPMSCTTGQNYKQPGQFSVKRTASASGNTITVTGLTNTACYGIHVDVERSLFPIL